MPTVQTNNIETYYEMRGEGPPIVFIHGALSDHTAATQQLKAFSEEYTAFAYDVRGHGRTTNPEHAPYSIDVLATDLHAFVTALGLERPVVCGVSMGGMIAQVYASRYPDQLSALVLADTFTPPFVSRRDRIERTTLVNAMAGLIRLVGYNRGKGLMLWFGRKLERDQTTNLRADAFPEMDTVDAVNSLRAVTSFHSTDIDLSEITAPTLILYGEHETSIISRHAPILDAEIPDATLREVPDAGHASPWDNPEYFNSTIQTFLTTQVPIEAG